jgi:predicted permease
MKLWSRLTVALRNLLRRAQFESQLDDEVRAYVDMVADERIAAGMSPSEARRTAMAEFGGIEQVKQAVRDNRAGTFIEICWQDVRFALRQMRRNRGFTLTAVITLGLGIGATSAIFSAVYSLLLKPLPYHDPNQLVSISDTHSAPIVDPDFVAARSGSRSFEQLAGFHTFLRDNLTGVGEPMRVTRAAVTANFFPTLGVVPQLGRNFSPSEDWSGAPNIVMLSDHLWRNKFNANGTIVGKAITLNGASYTVIGVLPRTFSFPSPYLEPDLYGSAVLERDTTFTITEQIWGIQTIARLRPGVTVEQAQTEMQAFFQARAQGYPAVLADWAKNRRAEVETLQRHLTGDDRKPLYILLISVATVLLISCVNVANLQLARAVSRRHETALRGALGASRIRLIRQFLVESLLLSSFAAVLGLAIAFFTTSLVRHASSIDASQAPSRVTQVLRLPFGKLSAAIHVDGWVLAFTVGLALATTLLFGLVPAISGSRTDLRNALQSAGMRISSGREQRLLRHTLLVIEVGLAVTLLAVACLLVRSFVHVMSYDSGFDASNTLTGVTALKSGVTSLSGASDLWPRERYFNFYDQLLPRLKALPGVKFAALTSTLPLDSLQDDKIFAYEGVPVPPIGQLQRVPVTEITPDYFRAVGTPILAGRPFSSADNETSPFAVIVNVSFAKRFFGGDALGKRFKTDAVQAGDSFKKKQLSLVTIVGVVDDAVHGAPEHDVQPEAFQPLVQGAPVGNIKLVLRTWDNPALLANSMRAAVTSVDAQHPLFDIQTLEQGVADLVAQRRLIMLLIASFAMLAVVLSAVGVYGVFAYSVNQRRQEMGIRLALGSTRGGVLRLVVMQAASLVGLGGILGLSTALALSRLLASLLVGVTPHDPVAFALAWALMTVVALLASTIPAAQAARTDLLSVLHSE